MRLARYDDNRLGLVRGDQLYDVTDVTETLPPRRWPLPLGDDLIANLDRLRAPIEAAADGATPTPISAVKLLSPVANPGKIIGAPVNYKKHQAEAQADREINYDAEIKTIDKYGLFLKANSALVGPGEGVALRFTDRRNDHEVELAAIIGRAGSDIPYDRALDHIAAYAIGLDMTVRGPEDRSLRKSIDSYAVLGPWLVTADEIDDPDDLDFDLTVNGAVTQSSNTSALIFDMRKLVQYASNFYTLHPGDIIMTGTPEGVGPVDPGDTMVATVAGVGSMTIAVRAA